MKTRLIALCMMFFCFMCFTPVVAASDTQLSQEDEQVFAYNDLILAADIYVLSLNTTHLSVDIDIRMPSKLKTLSMANYGLCRKNHLRNYHYGSSGGSLLMENKHLIYKHIEISGLMPCDYESSGGALPKKV